MKLGCRIVGAAGLHLFATTVHAGIEEEVKTATVTFDNMLRRCKDLNAIYEKEYGFSEIAITLV